MRTMFCEDGAPATVAIVGSRGYPELREVESFVRGLARKYPLVKIVSGGARGVDITAEEEARESGLIVCSYRPKKRMDGRSQHYVVMVQETSRFVLAMRGDNGEVIRFRTFGEAAFARNGWIVAEADCVVAFWDGHSVGTRDTTEKSLRSGKPLWIAKPGMPLALAEPIAA